MATKKRTNLSAVSVHSGSSLIPWLGFATIIILLDQVSKITITKLFAYAESLWVS